MTVNFFFRKKKVFSVKEQCSVVQLFVQNFASHFPSSSTAFYQGSRSFQNLLPKVSLQVSDEVIQSLSTASQHHPITVLTVRWRFQDLYRFNHRSDKGFLQFVQLQLPNNNHCQHCQHYFQMSPQSIFSDNNNVRDGPKRWFTIQNVCQGCLLNCGDVGFVNFALSTLEVQPASASAIFTCTTLWYPCFPLSRCCYFQQFDFLQLIISRHSTISQSYSKLGVLMFHFFPRRKLSTAVVTHRRTPDFFICFRVIGYFILVFFSYIFDNRVSAESKVYKFCTHRNLYYLVPMFVNFTKQR